MISADVCMSDAFLTMSTRAQALYYQCILNADDDGLVDNMRTIMRSLEVKAPALSELVKTNFILDLGDGIYCVKHWLINNNLIRKDRYAPTRYQEKLDLLVLKENRAYSLKKTGDFPVNQVTTIWQPNGNQVATIGKRRLD